MIHYDGEYRLMDAECDGCGERASFEAESYGDGLHNAKSQGWLMFRDPKTGRWKHYCPKCAKEKRRA